MNVGTNRTRDGGGETRGGPAINVKDGMECVYSIKNVPERNELRHEAEGTWNYRRREEGKKEKRKRRIEEDRRKL